MLPEQSSPSTITKPDDKDLPSLKATEWIHGRADILKYFSNSTKPISWPCAIYKTSIRNQWEETDGCGFIDRQVTQNHINPGGRQKE